MRRNDRNGWRALIACLELSALLSVTLWAGCADSSGASDATALFKQWFISPWSAPEAPRKFAKDQRSIEALLSAVRHQDSVPTGVFSTTLFDSTQERYSLGIRTPRTIDLTQKYPLIIYLHGGIGTTLSSKGETAHEMMAFLQDSIALFVASPSSNRYAPWWSPPGLSRILQSMRYMTLHYPIDPDRIFLAGVSDGGTGCYGAANTIFAPFAGFIAISGFGGMLQSLGMPLIPQNLMQRPIYNVNAGNDHLYPLALVNEFLDLLERNGVAVIRKVYPDAGHGFDYRIQETASLLQILRTWKKPPVNAINCTLLAAYPMLCPGVVSYTLSSPSPASISAFGINDTLRITGTNLTEAIIEIDADQGKTPRFIQNNTTTKRWSPLKKSDYYYAQILQSQIPAPPATSLIKVPF